MNKRHKMDEKQRIFVRFMNLFVSAFAFTSSRVNEKLGCDGALDFYKCKVIVLMLLF